MLALEFGNAEAVKPFLRRGRFGVGLRRVNVGCYGDVGDEIVFRRAREVGRESAGDEFD